MPSHINPALDEATWRKIVQLYQSGEMKIPALAARFGRTVEAIRQGLRLRNVISPSGQLKRKNSACTTNAASASATS